MQDGNPGSLIGRAFGLPVSVAITWSVQSLQVNTVKLLLLFIDVIGWPDSVKN